VKQKKNSSLRIAVIAEDRLAEDSKFEGRTAVLTPQNWRQVLRHGKPDLLLVESILTSNLGHWHLAQHAASPQHGELVAIAELARQLAIPSVFWITKGQEYHEHYRDYARHFDLVCCADPLEVDRLAGDGITAELLLPCVQPALYNPFRHLEEREDIGLHVLFDGWADLDRLGDEVAPLARLKPFGLAIIESRYEMFRNRLAIVPKFADQILGCVTPAGRRTALKYARSYATLADSVSSRTTQQWMSLEAAASRLPVVHCGRFEAGDIRSTFALECPTPADFAAEFARQQADELYRERIGHLAWRAVSQHHTFAHRLRTICRRIGVKHDWQEYPRASLITPTYRKDMLRRCMQTFEACTYPNKELVLVFNGNELPSHEDLGLEAARPDVVIAHVPRDLFAGETLNMGHLHSSGEYCFRVDDDDYYAPNYILDMVLLARSIDAGLFGKPSAPLIFEGEDTVYLRKDSTPLVIAPLHLLQSGQTWIGGNSISGSSEFFHAHGYSSQSYGAADTDLILNLPEGTDAVIALMDQFNMAAERRADVSSHTWKNSAAKLKSNRVSLPRFSELVV